MEVNRTTNYELFFNNTLKECEARIQFYKITNLVKPFIVIVVLSVFLQHSAVAAEGPMLVVTAPQPGTQLWSFDTKDNWYEVMDLFFKNLAAGQNKAEALRQAQLTRIRFSGLHLHLRVKNNKISI